jgi:phosphoribosyl 1,2-cyclic phosphodiesterase
LGVTTISLTVALLGSGSSGNSCFLSSGGTNVLIDTGFSAIELERRMEALGFKTKDLDAVILSHEHEDHIRGVSVFSRRHKLPVIGSGRMFEETPFGKVKLFGFEAVTSGREFQVGDLVFRPFPVPHDAEDPFGFIVKVHGFKLGYVTDLVFVPALVREALTDCHVLVLESNHDVEMLKAGPYPWPLKQRILSKFGHLSNEALAAFLDELDLSGCAHLFLAHLSRTNNDPGIARRSAQSALQNKNNCRTELHLTYQDRPSAVVNLY